MNWGEFSGGHQDAWGWSTCPTWGGTGGVTASGRPNSCPITYKEVVDLNKIPTKIWQSWSLQVFKINPRAAWPDLRGAHTEQEVGAETPSSHPSLHDPTKYRADHIFTTLRTNRVNPSEAAEAGLGWGEPERNQFET